VCVYVSHTTFLVASDMWPEYVYIHVCIHTCVYACVGVGMIIGAAVGVGVGVVVGVGVYYLVGRVQLVAGLICVRTYVGVGVIVGVGVGVVVCVTYPKIVLIRRAASSCIHTCVYTHRCVYMCGCGLGVGVGLGVSVDVDVGVGAGVSVGVTHTHFCSHRIPTQEPKPAVARPEIDML